jgi:hypothetical protein
LTIRERELNSDMIRIMVNTAFRVFNRDVLSSKECKMLDGGVIKHLAVLRTVCVFLIAQIALAVIAPDIFVLLNAVSFISLMLGSAWYTVSFQNVSEAQLDAGVADFITRRMFRAFMLSFSTLIICVIVFIVRAMFPEMQAIPVESISVWVRLLVMLANIVWIIMVWFDVYLASMAYDAADSLLGDGFPTLMRGAQASHRNSPLVILLKAIATKMGVKVREIKELNAPD